MRIGVVLSPHSDWNVVASAAASADAAGLAAIGLWDHYHAHAPELGYVAGWSAFGALASLTRSVTIVPMVINSLHYELGVLAKETSVMSLISQGRFELGIGAGDWKGSFDAWGRPFPDARERRSILGEAVAALRLVWSGEPVKFEGERIVLSGATCAPAPAAPPRVVVGCGHSRSLVDLAAGVADEINVYDDDAVIAHALAAAAAADRDVAVSVLLSWEWDRWPAQPADRLRELSARDIDRAFVSMAGDAMVDRIGSLARVQGLLTQ